MNKKILLGTGLALTLVLAGGVHHHANAITTSGDVEATILEAITLTATAELDFGNIVAGGTTGTVVMDTADGRTSTGGVTLALGGGELSGQFDLDGTDNATVTVDVPASDTVVSGGDNMTVDNFTWAYKGGAPTAGDGTVVLTAGAGALSIGATLNVGINQAAGHYQGAYDVTVNYQ